MNLRKWVEAWTNNRPSKPWGTWGEGDSWQPYEQLNLETIQGSDYRQM